ncbi:hypothetical protein KSS87_019137, partial [Heliosperma pusillum]
MQSNLLSQNEINLEKLQRIANTGLPSGGSLRATTWKNIIECWLNRLGRPCIVIWIADP